VGQAFQDVLSSPGLDLADLRSLSWKGIPSTHRAMAWQIMIGYVPTNQARRAETMKRKRAEYLEIVAQHFDLDRIVNDPIYKQVHIQKFIRLAELPRFQLTFQERVLMWLYSRSQW
jgi:hypothetical protein